MRFEPDVVLNQIVSKAYPCHRFDGRPSCQLSQSLVDQAGTKVNSVNPCRCAVINGIAVHSEPGNCCSLAYRFDNFGDGSGGFDQRLWNYARPIVLEVNSRWCYFETVSSRQVAELPNRTESNLSTLIQVPHRTTPVRQTALLETGRRRTLGCSCAKLPLACSPHPPVQFTYIG